MSPDPAEGAELKFADHGYQVGLLYGLYKGFIRLP